MRAAMFAQPRGRDRGGHERRKAFERIRPAIFGSDDHDVIALRPKKDFVQPNMQRDDQPGLGLLLDKRDAVGTDIGPPHLADVAAPLGRKQKQPERSSLFGSDRPSSLELRNLLFGPSVNSLQPRLFDLGYGIVRQLRVPDKEPQGRQDGAKPAGLAAERRKNLLRSPRVSSRRCGDAHTSRG